MKKIPILIFTSIFITSVLFSMPSAPPPSGGMAGTPPPSAPVPPTPAPPQPSASPLSPVPPAPTVKSSGSFTQLKWPDTGVRLNQKDATPAQVSKKNKALQVETKANLKKMDNIISVINNKRAELQDKFKQTDEELDKFLLSTGEAIGKQQGKVRYLNEIKK